MPPESNFDLIPEIIGFGIEFLLTQYYRKYYFGPSILHHIGVVLNTWKKNILAFLRITFLTYRPF